MRDGYTSTEEAAKKYWKSPKGKEAQSRYQKSEKGREARKRYAQSEKGREARRRYAQSEKGKIATLRYYLSKKGKEWRKSKAQIGQLFNSYEKFIKENPGCSLGDFLSTLNNSKEDKNGN